MLILARLTTTVHSDRPIDGEGPIAAETDEGGEYKVYLPLVTRGSPNLKPPSVDQEMIEAIKKLD